jgi:hypothetical protein
MSTQTDWRIGLVNFNKISRSTSKTVIHALAQKYQRLSRVFLSIGDIVMDLDIAEARLVLDECRRAVFPPVVPIVTEQLKRTSKRRRVKTR